VDNIISGDTKTTAGTFLQNYKVFCTPNEVTACKMNNRIAVPIMRLLGGKSTYKATIRPRETDKTDKEVDRNTSFLKEETQLLAVNTGITSNAPIKRPPMVLIPTQTTIASNQKNNSCIILGVCRNGIRYLGLCVAPNKGYQAYQTTPTTNTVDTKIATRSVAVSVKILPKR